MKTNHQMNDYGYNEGIEFYGLVPKVMEATSIKTIGKNELEVIDFQETAWGNAVDPEPTASKYLTFTANESGSSVGFYYGGNSDTGKNMQYSTDGGSTWQDYTIGVGSSNVVPITLEEGESVKFRGENENLCDNSINILCSIRGSVAASGDITSLLNGVGGDVAVPERCYSQMFDSCTSLTSAPELPSTTLADFCYYQMFAGCTSLTTSPSLPATTLSQGCYQGMFWNCTNLATAPELPATTLANNCYGAVEMIPGVYMLNGMFEGCSSLNYIKAMFTTEPSGTYLAKWVAGVSENGTFVMNSAAEWNPEDYRGENGIPVGWTVETAAE